MNEYDVHETECRLRDQADEVPNLATAAHILSALVEWANGCSDGWCYWPKPARAARSLMELLRERDYAIRFGSNRDGSPLTDASRADLLKALRPIKALLTTQGVDWNSDLPWTAILPPAA